MPIGSSVMLGLSIDDRGATCAEVATQGARRSVRRAGRFDFPTSAGAQTGALSDPTALGAALKSWLASHGFTASRAVIGVPSKWLTSSERDLPPLNSGDALPMLRLQAEAMSMTAGHDLVVDVAGDPSRGGTGGKTLLVAIMRGQLDRLTQLASAAGLRLEAVTATSLAAFDQIDAAAGRSLLLVGDAGAELVAGDAGTARLLRHISSGNVAPVHLASELKRTLALSGVPAPTAEKPLWVLSSLTAGQLEDLSRRAGIAMRAAQPARADFAPAALNGDADKLTIEAFAPAVLLASRAASSGAIAVDLLHSRLAAPIPQKFGRRTIWAVVIGVAAVVAIGLLYSLVLDREAEAKVLADQVAKGAPDAKAAQAAIDRFSFGRTYFERRTPVLDALREVTLAFDYNEPIWATSIVIRDNRDGVLQGRATNQQLVRQLLDRLKANPKLARVSLVNLQELSGRTREQGFTISFNYAGPE
jgi:hypothetical protein